MPQHADTDKTRIAERTGALVAVLDYIRQQPDARIGAAARKLGVSHQVIERLEAMTVDQIADYLRNPGTDSELNNLVGILDSIGKALQQQDTFGGRPWMEALEMQYAARAELAQVLASPKTATMDQTIVASWQTEYRLLALADAYTWGPEPTAAVQAAGRTIPLDAALDRSMTPGLAGWWYFPDRVRLRTTDSHDDICGLLWGWVTTPNRHQQGLYLSAQVLTRTNLSPGLRYTPSGSQSWFWAEGESIQGMLDRSGAEYDRRQWVKIAGVQPMPKDHVLKVSEAVGRMMLAGFAWMGQRILSTDSGHVERHRRKQLIREQGLTRDTLDVKIVHLRRLAPAERPAHLPDLGPDRAVPWNCRWIVDGHWRHQPFGPGRTGRRLKFIHPYVKGPEDRPLRVPKAKVFVVER